MTQYFSLHKKLNNQPDYQAQLLRENILYYKDIDRKQEFIYSYTERECIILKNDKVCLYLKRYYIDQTPHYSLNYPKINIVVNTKKNSELYHSQSINFDHLSLSKIRQQSTLILATIFLTQIIFVFENSQIAHQWSDLINEKIKENRSNKKKLISDQKNQLSIQHTINNLANQIDRQNEEIMSLKKIIEQKKETIAQLQKTASKKILQIQNNYRVLSRMSQNNYETFLESGNMSIVNDEELSGIINFFFKQIIKKNQLISSVTGCSHNSSITQLTRSNFITNTQDLRWYTANKLSTILRKDPQEIYNLIRS